MLLLKKMEKHLIGVLLVLKLTFVASVSWCNIQTCHSPTEHILCLYETPGPSARCSKIKKETTDEFRKNILKAHNDFRDKLAGGAYKAEKGYPNVADMRLLHYDFELEESAQRNVDNCMLTGDNCRDVVRFKVGQNLATFFSSGKVVDPLESVRNWTAEYKKYVPRKDGLYQFMLDTSHFTQIAWATTRVIGCATISFYDLASSLNGRYVACNYGPAGNQFGKLMYQIGEPCSKCPKKTKCDAIAEGYENLCAGVERVDRRYLGKALSKAAPFFNGFQGCILNYFFLVQLFLQN